MTKHRPPLSIEQALARIAGQLPHGYDDVAEVARRAPSTVRNWGNPDTEDDVPMRAAIRLDLAFQAAGGIGAPIYEAYTAQLKLADACRFAERAELSELTPEILRECGEAGAALVAALRPDASRRTRQLTRREVKEAIAVLSRALPLLTDNPDQLHQTGPPAAGTD